MSEHNIEFYQKIDIHFFKNIAVLQGFDTCYDLDVIFEIIQNAQLLIELGSGYGRLLKGLSDRNFQGKVIGVERSANMLAHLDKDLAPNITLVQQDYRFFLPQEQPDVVLLIWSGILELSRVEQHDLVKHIAQYLAPNGIFIAEIPRQVKYIGVHMGNQAIVVQTEWGRLEAYMPTHQEMLAFQEIGQFSNVRVIDYTTPTELKRAFYVYQK